MTVVVKIGGARAVAGRVATEGRPLTECLGIVHRGDCRYALLLFIGCG